MTREEAIECLEYQNDMWFGGQSESLKMAIKSLEQEPCEDCISRQAVLDLVNSDWKYEGLESDIENLPPVKPQEPKWIPVSERLPNKSGKYWCTFGGTYLTGTDFYTTKDDAEMDFDEPEEYVGWQLQNVIAWMPLPNPYKPKEDE